LFLSSKFNGDTARNSPPEVIENLLSFPLSISYTTGVGLAIPTGVEVKVCKSVAWFVFSLMVNVFGQSLICIPENSGVSTVAVIVTLSFR